MAVQTRALCNLPVMERGLFVGLLFALCGEPRAWTDGEVRILHEVVDRIRAAIARAEAEEHQRLLNGELAHRLKNTLAIVQSMASQTLRAFMEGVLTLQADLSRFRFYGPDLDVGADAAMSLSLLLHELATNS